MVFTVWTGLTDIGNDSFHLLNRYKWNHIPIIIGGACGSDKYDRHRSNIMGTALDWRDTFECAT